MIQNLKMILSGIREDREKEFEQYRSLIPTQRGLEEQKDLLTLELPFKTDPESIHRLKQVFLYQPELIKIMDNKKFKEANKYLLLDGWIKSIADEKNKLSYIFKSFLCQMPILEIWDEFLPYIFTLDAVTRLVEDVLADPNNREEYLSQARSLREFIKLTHPTPSTLFGSRGGLSLQDASKLFEYLETRALKSTKIGKFHDLLLCRTLFYVPIQAKEIFELSSPDEVSCSIPFGEVKFPVPKSFIKLWKGFSNPDKLFIRSFDDKQLHKKIQRLGEYAGLEVESLNSRVLRSCAKAIGFCQMLFESDAIAAQARKSR